MSTQNLFFPRIKQLLEAGETLPVIAQKTGLGALRIGDNMIAMHHAGTYDLCYWIEKNINSRTLIEGCEYFNLAGNPTVAECMEVLGFDENSAKFCQFYTQQKSWS